MPAAAWSNRTRDLSGRERPLSELPGRRWLEVEIHLIDIGRPGDPTYQDWSDDFVSVWLPHQRAGLAARLPERADGARRPDRSTSATSWPGSSADSTARTCRRSVTGDADRHWPPVDRDLADRG